VIGRSGGAPHALACAADKRLRDRLICTASLCGLAPYDADGLDWFGDMVASNVTAYQNAAEHHLQALIATFNQQAERVRNNSQGLINTLRPELVGSDREVMGDVALRRIIAQTHAEALRESVDGWIDDVIALAHPWSVELADITGPVLLWHGGDDVFIPASHTQWLHRQIGTSELRLKTGIAHFGAIKALPEILSWVLHRAGEAGFPPPDPSERQRVDHGEQPMVDARLDNVRVPVSEQLC
jgi:pimeloyl-ACP methyl ester carboxylesterase